MDKTQKKSPFNVSIKVRLLQNGTKTWECCVYSEEISIEETLAASDSLVSKLEERYPLSCNFSDSIK